MQFRVLGPLEVDAGDGPIPLGGPKQRAVLASLLIRANQVVPAEMLIDELWGEEAPEKARNTLQTYVSNIRKSLGDERLQGRAPGYVLFLDPMELDATRFDSLVRDAKKAMAIDPGVAITTLEDALALWRGPALADLTDRPSLLAEAARLDELRYEAQEDRIEGLIAGGHDARAIGELETLVTQLPLRESLWELLMLALYRDGRQADALNAYQRAREILADQLGIDPSAELARLQERILQHDPGLDLKGEALRGYRLLEKLGEGPDGVVFRALQPHVGRDVAVKVFREDVASDPAFVRRFEPDAQAAAALEHPHIVPTYDAWREPGRAYVASRYLRGGSLRALDARGEQLGRDRAARVAEQIASALAFAHRQGVTHGNVSAANVLFDAEGHAYLGDFLLRSAVAVDAQDDVRALAELVLELLGPHMPNPIAELVSRVDDGADVCDATAFLDAVRMMLEPSVVEADVRADARNPYKGLRPFTEADASDFFGRDALIEHCMVRLEQTQTGARFLAVVGPSGGGKSSMVRAGLIPAIRRGAFGGSGNRYLVEMFPGAHPIDELEAALLRIAVHPASRLRDTLESGSRGLLDALRLIVPGDAEVVLVVDQFEELFTLTTNERDRELMLESLRVACVDPESRVRVIVTLRADFYDRPLVYPRFGELLAARTEAVPPLTPDELELAIRLPAERVGVRVEPGLEAEMVADVVHQPGALPLLQYALTELFERRDDHELTLDSYRQVGGVAGALSARAERLYREADMTWQRSVRQVFLRLVALGEGTQDTRRRVARSELDAIDVEPGAVDDILETFGRHRLLTFDREPTTREPTVEIAHEALLAAWTRLGTWIDGAREDLRHEQRLARGASEWLGSGKDPSFLLRGVRLEQFEAWSAATDLAIGRPQREYIKASIDRRDLERRNESKRQEHEVRMERRSRTRLRALVAVFAIAALVAATLTIIAADQAGRASDVARVARARELAAAAISNLEVDPERSVMFAVGAVNETRTVDDSVLPEAEEALHRAIAASRVVMTVPEAGGEVAWSSAGTFAATAQGPPGTIVIADDRTGETLHTLDAHDGVVTGLAFSPDGSILATTGEDGALRLWDPIAGKPAGAIAGEGEASEVTFDATGSVVAAMWPGPGVIKIVDTATHRVRTTVRGIGNSATVLSPDGTAVAFESREGFGVIDVATHRDRFARVSVPFGAAPIAWSPDGRYLATGGIAGPMIWDAETGDLVDELPGHPWVGEIAWSPDSSTLVTAGPAGLGAKIWAVRDGIADEQLTLESVETERGIGGVAFSPDGTKVAAGATDLNAMKVWDVSDAGNAEVTNIPTVASFGDVGFLPDGRLVAAGVNGDMRIHQLGPKGLERGDRSARIGPRVKEHSFVLSPDGTTIAIAYGYDNNDFPNEARVWDTSTGDPLLMAGIATDNDGLDWSPDGTLLAITSTARPETLVMDRSGDVVAHLPDQDPFDTSAARFSPDGRLVATIGSEGEDGSLIAIWDWRRGELLRTMRTDYAQGLTFDRSGGRLVTMFGPPVIWDVDTGTRLGALDVYPGGVGTAAFTPDGRRIAATVGVGGVALFDAGTGAETLSVPLPDYRLPNRLAISADGSMVATQAPSTLGGPGIVRVLALDIDDLLEIARREVTRPITGQECLRYWHADSCAV